MAEELLEPIRVLDISTASTPLVAIRAYWRNGWEPFSIHTRWTLLWLSMTPVTSTGFDVLRLDISVCVELSFSVLLAVSCRLSTGSRKEGSVDIEGANTEATIRKDRKSVRCVFRVFSFLTRLSGGQSYVGAGCRTMLGQSQAYP